MATEERTKEILKALHNSVAQFEEEDAAKWAKIALEEGVDPFLATMEGLASGMMVAGEKYNAKEYFVPELLLCADALYAGLAILKPVIEASGRTSEVKGSIVLGVVEGDVHDIGKNLVKLMFEVAGWTVYDLGKDVPLEKFVEEQLRTDSNIVGHLRVDDHEHAGHAGDHQTAASQKPESSDHAWRRPGQSGGCRELRC